MRWKISLSHHKMGVIQMQYQNDLQVIQNSLKGCLLKKTLPTPQQRGFLGSQKSYIVFDHKFHFKALKDQRFMKPSRLSTVQTNTFLSLSTLTNIKSFDRKNKVRMLKITSTSSTAARVTTNNREYQSLFP